MDEIRRISKNLLGNRYRLEVAAAIARAEPAVVSAQAMATELGIAQNLIRAELLKLADAGLVLRLPRVSGQQLQEYQRLESVFWGAMVDLFAEFRDRVSQPG